MSRLLTETEITRQLADLPGWTRDGESLVASYEAPDFPTTLKLVALAGEDAERMNHHPHIDIRWTVTNWRLSSHFAHGLTQLDIELAHRISAAAKDLGAVAKEAP
jgi:4a-hydroxytetrahydrobiopterin dehydratase